MSSSTPPYSPRVAIVTGAAQGIGLDIALQLAKDGIDVAVNDLPDKLSQINEVVRTIRDMGRKAIALPADVTSEEQVEKMVETTALELGSVDIMIANAGIGKPTSFLETTAIDFDSITAVNFRGVFFCYQYAAKQMIREGHGGRIIGASSAAGKEGGLNMSVYSGTKFAIRGITHVAAKELAVHGILVNAYAPGLILTQLFDESTVQGTLEEKLTEIRQVLGLHPNTPAAGPEVVSNLISFLCKPETKFITGQTISVDGGVRFS
ncbi:NAD-binding protein [Schizopora paradoxa]|uniref:3-oxoacyl-[acyl-carrier-protein] reductase n=1 Tax=Schizopora paradoxa TaxID=27342 RepID=A0A0H2SBI2_9AGAM|nr:NAD-binding protein [Schizopora paradoxa]